jgi:hypothetical protein
MPGSLALRVWDGRTSANVRITFSVNLLPIKIETGVAVACGSGTGPLAVQECRGVFIRDS